MKPTRIGLSAAEARRLKDSWKRKAAGLYGLRRDLAAAKADGISECLDDLVIAHGRCVQARELARGD